LKVRVALVKAQDFPAGKAVGWLDNGWTVLGQEGPDRVLVGGDDRRRAQVREPQAKQVLATLAGRVDR
jgi:hypothetical protein